jgi:uncharacterized damage-inducible protein DinB
MMRPSFALLLFIILPGGPLLGQDLPQARSLNPDGNAPTGAVADGIVQSVAPLYETVKGYVIAAAEQMPESGYAYRPTEEVRSFGEILGHVAGSMYFFCGTVTGVQAPENFEERTTKSGLVEAIKTSFSDCDAAYAIDDEKAMEEVEFFGQTGTNLWVLTFNVAHNWEHYGNLVTYLRENGLVPPSSQGGD